MADTGEEQDVTIVEQTIRINASPATVWRYWTEPDRMREWWGAAATLDPRPGGMCRVEMSADGPVMSGEYLEVVPFERIVISFGWEPSVHTPDVPPGSSRVEVTFAADAGNTILTLRHDGLPDDATDPHRDGWAHYLPRLAVTASDAPV